MSNKLPTLALLSAIFVPAATNAALRISCPTLIANNAIDIANIETPNLERLLNGKSISEESLPQINNGCVQNANKPECYELNQLFSATTKIYDTLNSCSNNFLHTLQEANLILKQKSGFTEETREKAKTVIDELSLEITPK